MMSPKINRNTNALVLRKIQAELSELITDDELNPLIALSVLEEVFNADLNPSKNHANGQLVQKIVALLGDKDGGIVRAQRLKEFISIIVVGHSEACTNFTPE